MGGHWAGEPAWYWQGGAQVAWTLCPPGALVSKEGGVSSPRSFRMQQGWGSGEDERALVVLIVIWELDVQKFKYIEVHT